MGHKAKLNKIHQIDHPDKSGTPVLVDLSKNHFKRASLVEKNLKDIDFEVKDLVHGVVILPETTIVKALAENQVWVRLDRDSVLLQNLYGGVDKIDLNNLLNYMGIKKPAGIVGNLILGNSAICEADNIQYLARLRSHSINLGLPMVIDLNLVGIPSDHEHFDDAIELGLNLAIELGCDQLIAPIGNYLVENKNLSKIVDVPIFARESLKNLCPEIWPLDVWKKISEKVNGFVIGEIADWNNLINIFNKYMNVR